VLLAKVFRSLTFKRALISIAAFGAIVLTLLGYVYWSAVTFAERCCDGTTYDEITFLGEFYEQRGRAGLIALIARRLAEKSFEGSIYLLADPSFGRLAGNLSTWPSEALTGNEWVTFNAGNPQKRMRALVRSLRDGAHLLVGRDISNLDEFEQRIKIATLLCLFFVAVLAGFVSISLTRNTVGRIEAINTTSRAIMLSGLNQRIPLRGTRDEWDELADNLNTMLDRIEALMLEIKQVTDNIAHDLRTPLARMRGRLEKAIERQRQGDDDKSLAADLLANLDDVLHMFSSLIRISQIEARDRTAAFQPLDLCALIGEVIELLDAAAEDKGVSLTNTNTRQVIVRSDRDLLFDAFANLVDNAIRHGRPGGYVSVEVKECAGRATVTVLDDGPGIPSSERLHVFKRFYWLERSRHMPGNGLGLTLVAAVSRLHGAHIELADNAPDLKFEIRFPALRNFSFERTGSYPGPCP